MAAILDCHCNILHIIYLRQHSLSGAIVLSVVHLQYMEAPPSEC